MKETNRIADNVSKNIRTILKERQMNQQDFADLINYSYKQAGRFLRDGIKDLDLIQYIADVLKIEAGELLGIEELSHFLVHEKVEKFCTDRSCPTNLCRLVV